MRRPRKAPSQEHLPPSPPAGLPPGSITTGTQDTGDEPLPRQKGVWEHFSHAPVSLWVEDFSEIKRHLDSLRRSGIEDLGRYFRKHPEEVLSLARKVKVVRVNEATLRLFGAGTGEEFRDGLSMILGKESYEVFREGLIAFWKGSRFFASEATNLTLGGLRMHILIQAAMAPGSREDWSRLYVALIDVTALKQGMEELRASEERYRDVFLGACAPMMIVDQESGIVVEVNEGTRRLLGLAKTEVVGRHLAELFSPEGREQANALLRARGKDRDLPAGGLCAHHGSGRTVPVSASVAFVEMGGVRHAVICLCEAHDDKPTAPKAACRRSPQTEALLKRITGREKEILRLIAGGQTNRAIAEKLRISEKTVGTHRSRMMQKLDIHRLADLVRFAFAAGLSP